MISIFEVLIQPTFKFALYMEFISWEIMNFILFAIFSFVCVCVCSILAGSFKLICVFSFLAINF